jgi:hypothetical protein
MSKSQSESPSYSVSLFPSDEDRQRRMAELKKMILESGIDKSYGIVDIEKLYTANNLTGKIGESFERDNLTDESLQEIKDTLQAAKIFTSKMKMAGIVTKFNIMFGKQEDMYAIHLQLKELHAVNSKSNIDNIDISALYKYRIYLDENLLYNLYMDKSKRTSPEHIVLNDFTYKCLGYTPYARLRYYKMFAEVESTMVESSVDCIKSHISTLPDIVRLCDLNHVVNTSNRETQVEMLMTLIELKIYIDLQQDENFIELRKRVSCTDLVDFISPKVKHIVSRFESEVQGVLSYTMSVSTTFSELCMLIEQEKICTVSSYKTNDVEHIDILDKSMFSDLIGMTAER